jgi:hypothetical protein
MQRMADVVAGKFVLVVLHCRRHILCLGIYGPEPLGVWADQCSCGADHRVSMCAGVGDADVSHGGNRTRHTGCFVSEMLAHRKNA